MVTDLDRFIRKFKLPDPDGIEKLFLENHCYYFALILHTRLPESDIVYDRSDSHFLLMVGHELYDIRGNVTDLYDEDDLDDMVPWDEMENIDKIEYDSLVDSCINLE